MLYPEKKIEISSADLSTIEGRKTHLLGYHELNLHIKGEGKTNLRIWVSKCPQFPDSHNRIYFRVDQQSHFDYPLDEVKYLNHEQPILQTIVNKYGFNGATIDNIDDVLEITKEMKWRVKNYW